MRRNIFEKQKRAILLAAAVLALGGVLGWNEMPKQEDPRFPDRFASVTVAFPGAGAEIIERLIVRPLEREVAEISDVRTVRATARTDVAVVVLELEQTIYDTDSVWTRVDRALDRAEEEFPEGVTAVERDYEVSDLQSVTLALTGSRDWNTLLSTAERIEDRLRRHPEVRRVAFTPDFDTQVTVELAPERAQALGVSAQQVAGLLRQRGGVTPGGTAQLAARRIAVESGGAWSSLEEIRGIGIPVAGGRVVPLSSIAEIRRGPEEPVQETVRFNGERALIIGIVPQDDTDLIRLGRELESQLPALAEIAAPLDLHRLTYQPARVETRLADLRVSLMQGMLIVAAVVMLAMGLRIGGTVAVSVPAISLASLLVYYAAGGVLHQITIAALVVSLGLLVDNTIVVSERIQSHIDAGVPSGEAARKAVRELVFPLAAATGTTLAAFLPLLLSKGVSADFTRAIPQVVMLTLSIGFVFALTVIPTVGAGLFTPHRQPDRTRSTQRAVVSRLSQFPVTRPGRVILVAAGLLLVSTALLPLVKLQFFPGADRNQVVLELELPAGTTAEATSEAAWRVEQEIRDDGRVEHIAAFVGRSTPPFYYNLVGRSNAPNFAQLLVTTEREEHIAAVARRARAFAEEELAGITFVARLLEQGPPAGAPVEIRLFSADREKLAHGVRRTFQLVSQTDGTRDVRHDLDLGTLSLQIAVDDAAAVARHTSAPDAELSVLSQTRGIPAGEFHGGGDPAGIVVRSPAGRDTPVAELLHTPVPAEPGRFVPLSAVARGELQMKPTTVTRRNGRHVASVYAQLGEGTAYNEVLAAVEPHLPDRLPDGVRYEIGGVAESSSDANTAILEASYLGVAALLFILLLQFRSFRRVSLVLLTVPLAAVGVIPGLVLFDKPFGFTSMLGTISLIGIVVNNAIILLETIEVRRRAGEELSRAISTSVLERMRPILLTVATTVLALVPLLFSSSSLWPPFASAMISGLLASTVMTLLVVPAAYYLLFRQRRGDGVPARS